MGLGLFTAVLIARTWTGPGRVSGSWSRAGRGRASPSLTRPRSPACSSGRLSTTAPPRSNCANASRLGGRGRGCRESPEPAQGLFPRLSVPLLCAGRRGGLAQYAGGRQRARGCGRGLGQFSRLAVRSEPRPGRRGRHRAGLRVLGGGGGLDEDRR